MAIVIPSKNIYGDPINAKIRDNVIDNVKVEITKVAPDNDYESPVHNETFLVKSSDITNYQENETKKDFKGNYISTGTVSGYYIYSFAYLQNRIGYYNINISLNRIKNNSFITKLYNGKQETENGEVDKDIIYFSLSGTTETANANATVTLSNSVSVQNFPMSNPVLTNKKTTTGIINLPETPIKTTITNGALANSVTSTVIGLVAKNSYNIKNYTETDNYINISLKAVASFEATQLTGIGELGQFESEATAPMTGTYEKYVAEQIEITVYGNTIGISLTDGTVTYKNGNHPHSLSGNELLQEGTKTDNTITSEHLATGVLNSYARGKETAKLLCDIGEYKDENGDLKISVKNTQLPMNFNEGDLVIPMTKSANNEDLPMSRYKDGKPKVFEVVKTNFIYDGATWQELTLQEATQKGE